ncbi:HAD family hydrolase [Intestinimonas massiliensis (ex Afouda et al. 2020)]|uniref:HAD family hydrolase n=1 Tax=Intestinimonas massiliensis (ex Afouda et al. 2020) TaxID=1673721 RepID=UPI001FA7687F|nr:HAD family hydrolase [Intestinimonas massiliensis (ex Afouda et al. 2020)]
MAAQYTRDYYHMDLSTQEIMDEWLSMAADAYARVPLKPGAGEFLARCRDRGERMALVTACVPELCRSALAHHGLADWFEAIVFAQDLGMEKRDPRVFTLTAQRLGVAPADCTLYEDAPANCAAAKGVGMTVVGVYDPFYENYQDQVRENSHRYLRSFTELLM